MPPVVKAIGIDLAWSPRNKTGLARASVTDDGVVVEDTCLAGPLEEIVEYVRKHADGAVTAAIDAPTVVPFVDRMRECERELHRDPAIRLAHAAPYPGTRQTLGKCNGGVPRGEQLVQLLKAEGFTEVASPPARHAGRYAIEVFPAAAMVRLFGLQAPLVYKKKKKRTWDQCRNGLAEYLRHLGHIVEPRLRIPADLCVTDERGKALKSIEDRVDAAMCAYIAALAWLGRTEAIGTLEGRYFVMPLAAATEVRRISNALSAQSQIWGSPKGTPLASGTGMPEIARFHGIVIGMFYEEHGRPHFHARLDDFKVSVEIESRLVRGEFPGPALRRVLDWTDLRQSELLDNWQRARRGEPLRRIDPLP